jgi:hypothetical protein
MIDRKVTSYVLDEQNSSTEHQQYVPNANSTVRRDLHSKLQVDLMLTPPPLKAPLPDNLSYAS